MSRIDLHIHTDHSDGTGSVNKILEEAAKKKLFGVAITDHNEISGALEAARKASKYGVAVIIGEEVSTKEGHIVGLFLKEKIERGLPVVEVIRRIHLQGGLAVVPHPFPHYKGIGKQALERVLSLTNPKMRPDAVEVKNGFPPQVVFYQQLRKLNRRKWGLAEVGGSDGHDPSSVGTCWTEFDGSSPDDLRQAILLKKTSAGGTAWSVLEMVRVISRDATRHISRRFQSR